MFAAAANDTVWEAKARTIPQHSIQIFFNWLGEIVFQKDVVDCPYEINKSIQNRL